MQDEGIREEDRRRGRRRASGIAVAAAAIAWLLAAGSGVTPVAAEEPEPSPLRESTVLADSAEGWADGGSSACIECHDQDSVLSILETRHSTTGDQRTPFAKHGCETCHGPGAAHVDDPDIAMSVAFGPDASSGAQNDVCLTCHQGGGRIHWSGSRHESEGVACATCHNVHAASDTLLAKDVRPETFVKNNQTETCYGCHPQVRAEVHRISSHPFREGRVDCSDCHNVHGSVTDSMLRQETLNETCYECHAEKRGPFLWEHQPSRDDCSNCHVPHGSNHRTLLEARTPWLCQSCHDAQFHPGTAATGSGLAGSTSPNRNLLLKDCLNCHTEVHGSNHPSGVRFTR
jgi:DmsE family decaheme c-type cytochrome